MNNFTAKKLGEVLAFERVLAATFERGGQALARALGQNECERLRDSSHKLALSLETDDVFSAVREAILAKAEKTQKKLTDMQNLYLTSDEDWDDAAELMEWLGFFEGAAQVHWKLVVGAAGAGKETAVQELAHKGFALHGGFLSLIHAAIEQHGGERAQD